MFSPDEETPIERSVVFLCFHREVKLLGGGGPLIAEMPKVEPDTHLAIWKRLIP